MPNITSVGAGDWVRQMLYSYPGWGKTSYIATGAEAGLKTLIIRSPMDQIPARALASGAEQIIISHWEELTGGDGIQDYLRMADHGFEWVWFDCVSIIQDVLLDDVWESVALAKPHRAWIMDKAGNKVKPNLTPTGGKDRGEYWTNADRLQQFVRHVTGANSFHFGMTAHPQEGPHPTDPDQTLLMPWIQVKNMPEKFCGYCNIVSFLEVVEVDDEQIRRMHVRENPRFYAKDLYDALPKGYMDNPTVPKLMEAIEAAKKTRPATARRRRGAQPAAKPAGRRAGRRKAA